MQSKADFILVSRFILHCSVVAALHQILFCHVLFTLSKHHFNFATPKLSSMQIFFGNVRQSLCFFLWMFPLAKIADQKLSPGSTPLTYTVVFSRHTALETEHAPLCACIYYSTRVRVSFINPSFVLTADLQNHQVVQDDCLK